jgi:hypothetical protein
MRLLLLACALLCVVLSGCAQEDMLRDASGHGRNSMNLLPTDREDRAGER